MTEDDKEIEYDEEDALNYALARQKQAEEKARETNSAKAQQMAVAGRGGRGGNSGR